MEIRLASNEVIYKKFEYTTRKGKNSKRSLIVTNKRLISEIMDKTGVKRKEIPIEEAEFISTSYANTKSSVVGIVILIILGAALEGVGLKVPIPIPYGQFIAYGIGALFLILAIILLIKYFINRQATVELTISGVKRETNIISLGSSNMSSKGKMNDIKIQVDRNQSIKMVNELGATLLDVKNLNLEQLQETQKEEKVEPKREEKKKNKKEEKIEEPKEEIIPEEEPVQEEIKEEIIPEEVVEEEIPEEIQEDIPEEANEEIMEEDPLAELEEKIDNAIEVKPEEEGIPEEQAEEALEESDSSNNEHEGKKKKGKKRK
ncbi:MAG: hypothetical protein J6Y42_02740 [Bacilli bacterium]|nr:hypothetical protein [Bacilli bacterium]